MVVAEHFAARRAKALGERTAISWTVAILVGIAQVVAGVFPGTSRSAATIFVALLFGTTSRVAATEFAFLVGIPTMFAATAYELVDVIRRSEEHTSELQSLMRISYAVFCLKKKKTDKKKNHKSSNSIHTHT